jgi:hypothetical protein
VTHVKSNLHEFCTCKIDFTYIRYYLAAKIDFTVFPILAAPDPLLIINQLPCSMIDIALTKSRSVVVRSSRTHNIILQFVLERKYLPVTSRPVSLT